MRSIAARVAKRAAVDLEPGEEINVAIACVPSPYLAFAAVGVVLAIMSNAGPLAAGLIVGLVVAVAMYGLPAMRRWLRSTKPTDLTSTAMPPSPVYLAVTDSGFLVGWRQTLLGRTGPLFLRLPARDVADVTIGRTLGIFLHLRIDFADGRTYRCQVPAGGDLEEFGVSLLAHN